MFESIMAIVVFVFVVVVMVGCDITQRVYVI